MHLTHSLTHASSHSSSHYLSRAFSQKQYKNWATEIIEVTQLKSKYVFQEYESMSRQITSQVTNNDKMNWPYVQFVDFAGLADVVMKHTFAKYVAFTPLVEHVDRNSYENFTYTNQDDWISTSLSYTNESSIRDKIYSPLPIWGYNTSNSTKGERQEDQSQTIGSIVARGIVFSNAGGAPRQNSNQNQNNINEDDDVETSHLYHPAPNAPRYAPIAQIHPLRKYSSMLKYDGFDHEYYRELFDAMVESRRAVFSKMITKELVSTERSEGGGGDGIIEEDPSFSEDNPSGSYHGTHHNHIRRRKLSHNSPSTSSGHDDNSRTGDEYAMHHYKHHGSYPDAYDGTHEDWYEYHGPQPTFVMLAPIHDRIIKPFTELYHYGEPYRGDDHNAKIVGAIMAEMRWTSFFCSFMPDIIRGIRIVVKNRCDHQQVTFQINGPRVDFIGNGDLHDPKYDEYEIQADFDSSFAISDNCVYSMSLYPSDELKLMDESKSGSNSKLAFSASPGHPIIWTVAVILIFVAVSLVFGVYDYIVERRQQKVLSTAIRSSSLVNSLFPAAVRDRLLDATEHRQQQQLECERRRPIKRQKVAQREQGVQGQQQQNKIQPLDDTDAVKVEAADTSPADKPATDDSKSGNDGGSEKDESPAAPLTSSLQMYDSKPIAELFPHATVLFGEFLELSSINCCANAYARDFYPSSLYTPLHLHVVISADLVGFTSWSSSRMPSQVFVLLETLYSSFDNIARKLGVFKVRWLWKVFDLVSFILLIG